MRITLGNTLPPYPDFVEGIRRAPDRGYTLTPAQTITALTYIIHSGFISGYQNRYGDNLKPPTNVYHRMTA